MAFDSTAIRPAVADLPEITQLEDRVAAIEEGVPGPIQAALDAKPDSAGVDTILVITQSEYDALETPDGRTLYVVVA
jgi:hypothetical protein